MKSISAKDIATEVAKILKDNKNFNQDRFRDTENLYSGYLGFKKSIEKNNERINDIKLNGLNGQKKNINFERVQGGKNDFKGIPEIELEAIENLKKENEHLLRLIMRAENALIHIEDSPYYDLIKLKYFENKDNEYLADYFKCDIRTVQRNKNKLINILKKYVFIDDFLN